MQKNRKSFVTWLCGERRRDDVVGDLAHDVWTRKKLGSTMKTIEQVEREVRLRTSDRDVLYALRKAIKEYNAYLI